MSWKEYKYQEVAFLYEEGKMTKWKRVLNVKEWLNENPDKLSYFQSVQSFRNFEKTDGEEHICPFYIDLDSEENLQSALLDARKIIDYYLQGFGVEPEIFFSGNRGFHIEVPAVVYGVEPHSGLTYIWHHLLDELVSKLDIKTVDQRVYSVPRLWRIANTQHNKSGLYKIKLGLQELSSVESIRELAINRRDYGCENISDDGRVSTDDIQALPEECEDGERDAPILIQGLADRYQKALHLYEDRQKVTEEQTSEPYDFEDDPPCVQFLTENGLAQLGTKNRADMAFAGYLKDSGATLNMAVARIGSWARSILPKDTHVGRPEERVTQSIRVLKTVYGDSKYHFSCGSMKQCGDVCNEADCNVQKKAIDVDIADYASAEHMGKRISIEADAIGRNKDEMLVPVSVTATCKEMTDSAGCNQCRLALMEDVKDGVAERTIEFNSRNPMTLDLIGSSTHTILSRMKAFFGIPSRCNKTKLATVWGNAQVIHLASRVSTEFKIESTVTRLTCMYLAHKIKLNHGYKFTGYVWPKSNTLAAIFIADSVEPLQSQLSTFTLNEDELEELKIFQTDGSPFDKVAEIQKIFMHNFTYIYGRDDLHMAMDLVFHSVRWIDFQKRRTKGWLDILVIGDTGQGKSTLAELFMQHYNLGTMAAGESSSRTGLAYSIQMVAGETAWVAFGLLARANGYLVVIDEAHGIAPADFRQLTLIRSKGIIDVKMVAWGTAEAQVRAIWIANPKTHMALGSYGYPVMAIPDVPAFGAYEDIRRFDFAIGQVADRLDDEVLNQDVYKLEELDNPYTEERCRNLILWVWTLTPEQIIISKETEAYTLRAAVKLAASYVPTIPLIEPADTKQKIIRIAAAFAGRTFNSPDGKTLVIENRHVDAATQFINNIYKSPDMDYFGYSEDHMKIELSSAQLESRKASFILAHPNNKAIAHVILTSNIFTKGNLKNNLDMPAKDLSELISFLISNRFITAIPKGYSKTVSGKAFMKSILDEVRSEQSELDMSDVPEEATGEDDF